MSPCGGRKYRHPSGLFDGGLESLCAVMVNPGQTVNLDIPMDENAQFVAVVGPLK
ncbi:hypothetical protein ACQYRI_15565 [Salmonella enterica]